MRKLSIILVICVFFVFVIGNCQEVKADSSGDAILTGALMGLAAGLIGYMIDSQRKIADNTEKKGTIEKHIIQIKSNKNVKIKINNNFIGITPLNNVLVTRDENEIVIVAAYSDNDKLLEQKTFYSGDKIPDNIYFDINN